MLRRMFMALAAQVAFYVSIKQASSQEAPMKDTIISTATIPMSIIEAGEGPLVLFCHGFPETKYAWRHQIEAFARAGYRAVAPDMRGYGKTKSPERPDEYTIFHSVGDLVALLDALGERQAVLVGHDWGATIAWQAAVMRPDRFRAVVALSVPMMGQPPVPPSRIFPQDDKYLFYTLYFQDPAGAEVEFGQNIALTLRKLIFAASGEAGPRLPGDNTPNPFGMVSRTIGLLKSLPEPAALPDWLPALDFERLVQDFETSSFKGGLNYYRNLDRNWELQHATSGLTVNIPALFMIGERDTGLSIPGMDQIIAGMPALVPDLRGSHVISEAGHWLQQERPHEVSETILKFLNDI